MGINCHPQVIQASEKAQNSISISYSYLLDTKRFNVYSDLGYLSKI